MAEIPNSDSPSPYASSTPAPLSDDISDPSDDSPSDASSILTDTDAEEDNDDDDSAIDDDDDEEDEDEDDYNDAVVEEEDDDEDHYFDHQDFDGFGVGMRGIDFDELDFLDGEHLRPDDYLDLADEDHFDALHHAIFHELGHHLAHEHWAFPPARSPVMDPPQAGPGGRSRMQIDQLVQFELSMGQANPGGGDAAGSSSGGGGGGNGAAAAGGSRRQVPLRPDIIDLTGDDDDAEMQDQPNPAGQSNQPGRSGSQRRSENQRRLRSHTQNAPPRLNRSDASYVDDQHVIVVSSSDDDEDQPMLAAPRRNAPHGRNGLFGNPIQPNFYPNRPNDYFHGRGARNARSGDQARQPPAHAQDQNPNLNPNLGNRLRPITQLIQNIPIFQFMNNPPAAMANRNHNPDDDIVITGERNIAVPHHHLVPLPGPDALGLPPIHFNYNMRPHHIGHPIIVGPRPAAVSAKPPHEPPQPARPGFTRDTGEDVIAVCPSCDQELAYDPEDGDDASAAPAKKTRSKKATAEHHFWAVKACGHVSKLMRDGGSVAHVDTAAC